MLVRSFILCLKHTYIYKYISIRCSILISNFLILCFVIVCFLVETSQSSTAVDYLFCGCCRTSYPLSEIIGFIEHKINHCRSNLQGCQNTSSLAAPEDSDPEDTLALKICSESEKNNSVPSISAPMIKKVSGDRLNSPSIPQDEGLEAVSPLELRAHASSTPKRRTESPECQFDKQKNAQKRVKVVESVDADTNTTSMGKN